MTDQQQHPAVQHPVRLRLRADAVRYERGLRGRVAAANDVIATHLGLVFGSVWVVWAFFIWPLIAQYMGTDVLGKTSYYAQSWVQLYALPLFVYIGNKLQKSSDAQSESMHRALTHIATVADRNAAALAEALDRLDVTTEGGIKTVLDELKANTTMTASLADYLKAGRSSLRPRPPQS